MRLLLGFLVQLLRLLFQLLETSLGIDVDGILCYFALQMTMLAKTAHSRNQAHRA